MSAAPLPPSLSVRILGGGRDIGRSCLLLSLGTCRVLLDCGAHPGFADARRRFPDLASLPPLDAVVITHFHLDHAGALPLLRALQRRGDGGGAPPPVLMTKPTRGLAALMLRDFFETSEAREQEMPFGDEDVREALDAVVEVGVGEVWRLGGLSVEAYYAGHVLGAVMFRVSVRGAGCVVYSGDYTAGPDVLLGGADVPVVRERVDVFITETTYCSTIRKASRKGSESELVKAVVSALRDGGKVLIPVSALGRAQEIIAVLAPLWTDDDGGADDGGSLCHVPVYVAAGLMKRASAVYDESAADWCCGAARDASTLRMPQLREFRRGRDWDDVTAEGPMVMFATPGNLTSGVSQDVFRAWCGDPRNVVVVPGFCFSSSLAARLRDDGGGALDVRCRLVNMSLAAHADARGILRTVRRLRPRAVILVHGEESKIAAFEPRLRKALEGQVRVFAPANGDTVELAPTAVRTVRRKRRRFSDAPGKGDGGSEDVKTADAAGVEARPGGDHGGCEAGATGCAPPVSGQERIFNAFVADNVDEDWRQAIEQYRSGAGDRSMRKIEAGLAKIPVEEGVSFMARLYADLIPDVERLEGSSIDFIYKDSVTVRHDGQKSVVEATWDDRTKAAEGNDVISALEACCEIPQELERD